MATNSTNTKTAKKRVLGLAYALDDVIEASNELGHMRYSGNKVHSMILDDWDRVDLLVDELRHCIESATAQAVGVGWFLRFGMSRPGQFETRLRLHLKQLADTCWRIDDANRSGRSKILLSYLPWPMESLERATEILQAVAVPPDEEDRPPDDLINHERAAEIADCTASTIRRWLDAGKLVGYDPSRQISESEFRKRLPQIRERRPRTKKGKRA